MIESIFDRFVGSNNFIFDVIETWPVKFIEIINENEQDLREYLKFEYKIDRLAQEDVQLRINRPLNKHSILWENINSLLKAIIDEYNIVSFHCSRLTCFEKEQILKNGLQPLNKVLLEDRIKRLYSDNKLSDRTYKKLISENVSDEYNRKGKIFFFHCLKTLQDEGGLRRLFRHWGGESLYYYHENDFYISKELRNIGQPSIIISSISFKEIDRYGDLVQRMIHLLLKDDSYFCEFFDVDSNIDHIIQPDLIIDYFDQDFNRFTNYNSWNLQYKCIET